MVTSYRSAMCGTRRAKKSRAGRSWWSRPRRGVEPVNPLVVDQALVLTVGEAAERDGRPLHVGEEALEALSIVAVDPSLPVDGETRMIPGPHALHGLGPHLLAAEHHPEEPLPEDLLEAGEVDFVHGKEDAVGSEEPEGHHAWPCGWCTKISPKDWGETIMAGTAFCR